MTTRRCCEAARTDPVRATVTPRETSGGRRTTLVGRGLEAAGWVVPTALLALLPKCPVCLAAYVAVGTGFGLSVPAAAYMKLSLVALCAGSLGFLAVRRAHRLVGLWSSAKGA